MVLTVLRTTIVGAITLLLFAACAPLPPIAPETQEEQHVDGQASATQVERLGTASYLSDDFHGQLTASGVPYDKDAMVAAHADLPFETDVLVTSLDSGQAITVTIVDRLPEKVERIIDLSSAAAAEIGMIRDGETEVRLDVVQAAVP